MKNPLKNRVLTALLAVVAFLSLSLDCPAASSTWTNLLGGSWTNVLSWTNNVIATGSGNTGDFSQLSLGAARTVSLDGAQTIGNLIFGDLGNTYGWTLNASATNATLPAANILTLSVVSGSPVITVNGQTNSIGLVVAGSQGMTKAGPGTLSLNAVNTYSGLTLVNGGVLVLGNSGGGSAGTIGSSAIVVTNGAELDLNNGDVLGYSSTQPLTVYGTVKKIYNQNETLNRPVTLSNGTFTNTLATNTSAFELFGNYLATAPNTTNWITGSGQFGLRTSTTYFTNAPGSVLNISAQVVPYTGGCPLNKYGSGTLALSASNTYSGNTVVNGGTLALTGSAAIGASPSILVAPSALLDVSGLVAPFALGASQSLTAGNVGAAVNNINGNFSSGGTLNVAGTGTNGTLTINGNLALTGGTLLYDFGGTSDVIALAGASPTLSLSGTTTLKPSSGLSDGTYTLINNFSSLTSGTAANLALAGGAPRGATATFSVTPPAVTLTISGTAPGNLVWQGNNGVNWDAAATINWLNTGTSAADQFFTLDNVTFDDTGRAPVSLVGALYPTSVTVSSANTNFNFGGSGSIAGAAILTVSGGSTLTISNANTFSGGTSLSAGKLKIGNASALGTGPLAMTGGILDLNSNNLSIGSLSGTVGCLITDSNNITASTNGTFSRTTTFTVNQVVSNAFAGLINNSVYTNGNIWTSNSVPVTNKVQNTVNLALVKNGSDYLLLTNANNYSGGTTINAGTLEVTGNSGAKTYTVAQGATLKIGYSVGAGNYSYGVTVNGTGASDPSGFYIKSGQSLDLQSTLTLQTAPSTVRVYGGTGVGTLIGWDINNTHLSVAAAASGSVLDTNVTLSCSTYGYRINVVSGTNNANGDVQVKGVISGSVGGVGIDGVAYCVRKDGTGSVLLTNASTYLPGMSITGGSVILAGGNNRLPAGSGLVLGAGTLLQLNGISQTFTNITADTTGGSVVGGSTTTSTLVINNASAQTNACALGGAAANQNNLSLVKTGAGLLVLPGKLFYTNNTTISAGSVLAGSLTNADGATLSVVDVAGTLTATNLTLGTSAGSTVAITSFVGAGSAPIVANNLTTRGVVTISLAGNLTTGVQYPLIKYTSGTIGGAGFGAFQLLRGMSGTLINNTANSSVDVLLSGTNIYPLAWKGNVNSTWDINGTTNWAFNVLPSTYLNNDNVQLDDSAVVTSTNIILNASVTPSAFNVTNNLLPYTLSGNGALAGNIGLAKSGTGSLTLLTTNTYTGVTAINGGTISIPALGNGGLPGPLGSASNNPANLVLNGGTLAYSGLTNSSDRGITLGTNNGAVGGTISVLNATNALTLNGPANSLTGGGSLTKNGNGTLILSTLNNYAGTTVVNGGKLVSTVWEWYGRRGIGSGLLTINSGATAEFTAVHGFGVSIDGRAAAINGGTLWLDSGNYVTGFTMTGGLVNSGTNVNNTTLTVSGTGMTVTANPAATMAVVSNHITSGTYSGTVGLTLVVSNGAAPVGLELDGNLTDGGIPLNLTKNGAGTALLTGANTYSGNTTINGGTLALSGFAFSGSSPVITLKNNATLDVSALVSPFVLGGGQTLQGSGNVVGAAQDSGGSIIVPGGITNVGTLHFAGELTLAATDTLDFDLGKVPSTGGGTNNDQITVAGNLTLNPGTTVNINPIQLALAQGSYRLITYTGTLTDNSGGISTAWTLGYAPSGRIISAVLSTATPGEIDLVVTGSPAALVWKGDGTANVWDIQSTPNWNNGGLADEFYALDNVLFDDTGSSSPAVAIQAAVTPSSVLVTNSHHYTFNSSNGSGIDGGTGLTKDGAGALTILNSNPYTGTTLVNNGTLEMGDGITDGAITASPILNNATLKYNVAGTQSANTPLSGTGLVVKAGAGELNLNSGANSWTGGLNILSGTVKPLVNNTLPAGESVTIAAGGAYDFNGVANGNTTTRGYSFTIAGAGPDASSGALVNNAVSIASYASVSNLTLSADATIGGSGRWDVGSVTNSMINGNGHALTSVGSQIDLRTQIITNVANLQITSGNVWYENFSQTNPWTATMTNYLAAGATLGIYGSQTINVPIVSQGGTINNKGSGTPVWSGPVDAEQATTFSSAGGSLVFAGSVTTNLYGSTSGSITLSGNNTISFAGNVTVPLAAMSWSAGTVQLGYNTASGSVPDPLINVPAGATFSVNRSDLYTLTNAVGGDGYMSVLGTNGLVVNASAAINIGNTLSVGQGGYGKLLVQPGASITANGLFLGNPNAAGGGDVIQTGGTLATTNASTYFRIGHWATETSTYVMGGGSLNVTGTLSVGWDGTGNLRQTNGTINVGVQLDVPQSGHGGPGTYALEGGSLIVGGSGIYYGGGSSVIYLGGGTVGASTNWSTTAAMVLTGTNGNTTFDTGGNTITLGGALSSVGGLVKAGTGVLSLSGANTYGGATLVNNGTLLVNGSLGASPVTVANNATLTGVGLLKGTVVNSGTLAVGTNGLGTLTVSNNLTLNSGSSTTLAIDRTISTNTFGKVKGITAVRFGGSLTVTSLGGTFINGDTFTLFSAGTYASNFTATNLPALAAGLKWNWNPAAGTLAVGPAVNLTPVNITTATTGGNWNLSWPADHLGWRLQVQTNSIGTGLGVTWHDWPNSTGTTSVSVPLDPNAPTVFFRMVYP